MAMQVNIEEYVNHVDANSYMAYNTMEHLCGNCLIYPAGLQQNVLTPHWMGITYFQYPKEDQGDGFNKEWPILELHGILKKNHSWIYLSGN